MAYTDNFCRNVAGRVIAETSNLRLYSDAQPAVAGHFLVVPRTHIERFADVPSAWAAELETLVSGTAEVLLYDPETQQRRPRIELVVIEHARRGRHARVHVAAVPVGDLIDAALGKPADSRGPIGDHGQADYTYLELRSETGTVRRRLDLGGPEDNQMMGLLRTAEGWTPVDGPNGVDWKRPWGVTRRSLDQLEFARRVNEHLGAVLAAPEQTQL